MRRRLQIIKYLSMDVIAALIVWIIFYFFRVCYIDPNFYPPDSRFWVFSVLYPLGWIFLHYLSGYYNVPYRKSRLDEFFVTFFTTIIGTIMLFFIMLINDKVRSYEEYYQSIMVLFSLQFLLTYFARFIITQRATRRIHSKKWGFNTLVIGTGLNARKISDELNAMKQSLGYTIVGYVAINDNCKIGKERVVGDLSDLDVVINENKIEEVIIALDDSDREDVFPILSKLYPYRVEIKLQPKLYEILIGSAKIDTIYATPLINITDGSMPLFQQNLKRVLDIVFSSLVLILFSPLYLYTALRVKLSSAGPIFFPQERLGKYGTPFTMYKFRSMYVDAENETPLLSSINDERITSWGKVMRKYRLDEFPQFWNVLKGDMAIVGPRPERKYFADLISQKAPHYSMLHRVKPGITSWGMVKFGYADTVEKMIERLQYDILYLENMSLFIDLKILIYTIKILITGKGI